MQIDIRKLTSDDLEEFGTVSIAFTSHSRLRVEWIDQGIDGIRLSEEPLSEPLFKDFDAERGVGPQRWRSMFEDISHWGIFGAYTGSKIVGGAVVSYATPGFGMLEGRDDLAILTNIRVAPNYRSKGVGTALFKQAVSFAQTTPCERLKIQTQNTNPSACRFYARQGCRLERISPLSEDPTEFEVDLYFYLNLKNDRNQDE